MMESKVQTNTDLHEEQLAKTAEFDPHEGEDATIARAARPTRSAEMSQMRRGRRPERQAAS